MPVYFLSETAVAAGALLADGGGELAVPPEAGGAGDAAGVVDEAVADGAAAESADVVAGLVVSPVGGFILSE